MTPQNIPIIIPSLDPEENILDLIHTLRSRCDNPIIIVNDGSHPGKKEIFSSLAAIQNCMILEHPENCGKGRALKTGFASCLERFPDLRGAVTADGDGQHTAEDIIRCIRQLADSPCELVIGCRNFASKDIPWKSRWGNLCTRFIFSMMTGLKLSDTQSGLRGIPAEFMQELLHCPGERFEFETAMLLATRFFNNSQGIRIKEFPIRTVYIDANRQTHFRPIADSIKIYCILGGNILRKLCYFACSGGLAALADLLLFSLFFYVITPCLHLPELLVSTVAARMISAFMNYVTNRNVVFRLRSTAGVCDLQSVFQYFILCIFLMGSSYGLVKLCTLFMGTKLAVLYKTCVDLCLFFLSYHIQNKYIFTTFRHQKKAESSVVNND